MGELSESHLYFFLTEIVLKLEEAQKNKEIAINKNDSLNQVLNEMDSAKTGPLFDQRKAIASVAQFIGMDPNKLNLGDPNSMVIVTQRLNEYVLEVMKSMKGTQTENDREFVINSKPKPTDTPEQIAASIANLKKVNERTIEHGEAQEKWVDQYGSLGVKGQNGKSFQQNWSDYINSHPLFPVKKKR